MDEILHTVFLFALFTGMGYSIRNVGSCLLNSECSAYLSFNLDFLDILLAKVASRM